MFNKSVNRENSWFLSYQMSKPYDTMMYTDILIFTLYFSKLDESLFY